MASYRLPRVWELELAEPVAAGRAEHKWQMGERFRNRTGTERGTYCAWPNLIAVIAYSGGLRRRAVAPSAVGHWPAQPVGAGSRWHAEHRAHKGPRSRCFGKDRLPSAAYRQLFAKCRLVADWRRILMARIPGASGAAWRACVRTCPARLPGGGEPAVRAWCRC